MSGEREKLEIWVDSKAFFLELLKEERRVLHEGCTPFTLEHRGQIKIRPSMGLDFYSS